MWVLWRGGASLPSAPREVAQGLVPGYRGFHWCVRPSYTRELKEMHCSSRKLLPSGGHSCRARDGRLQEELGPTKAFLSRLSRKWLQPGWPGQRRGPRGGLSFSLSVTRSLEGARTSRRAAVAPQTRTCLAPLVHWAGSFHVPTALPPPRHTRTQKARLAWVVLVLAPTRPASLGRGPPGCLRLWPQCWNMAHGPRWARLPRTEEERPGSGGQLVTLGQNPNLGGSPSEAHEQPGGEWTSDANTGPSPLRVHM